MPEFSRAKENAGLLRIGFGPPADDLEDALGRIGTALDALLD